MKLSIRDARATAELLKGLTLRLSTFSNEFMALLRQDGMVNLTRLNVRSSEVQAKDPEALKRFLEQRFSVADINTYVVALEAKNPTRADLAHNGIGTKHRSIEPKSGIHLNSPNAAIVIVDGIKVTLDFPPYCALFINKNAKVSVPADAVFVGVENFENITFATRQLSLFDRNAPIVFVERGPVMRSWIASLKNEYIHFGDIDLAGIGIYLTEFAPHFRTPQSFFVPDDIEERLALNKDPESRKNYEKQFSQHKNIRAKDPRLQKVIMLIHKYKGGIEQEAFIKRGTLE